MHVSPQELKHLWGKIRNREPSDKTLNALAKFACHETWKIFALHVLQSISVTTESINSHHRTESTSNTKWKLLLVIIFVSLLIVLFFMIIL